MSLIDPLHNGAGEGLGLIDRPIIRERTTGFPYIQPTSIKGVFRSAYKAKWNGTEDEYKLYALFGPDHANAKSHEGAAVFGEGQLLAFPVRSFKGCFVWVTSPKVLLRFKERLSLCGKTLTPFDALLKEVDGKDIPVICTGSKDMLTVKDKLILEEVESNVCDTEILNEFASAVSKSIFSDKFLQAEFGKKLVVLPDDAFRFFVENATEVVPNIRIGENGVTDDGSLRYTEYLPRESVMYCTVTHWKAKKPSLKEDMDTPGKVKGVFESAFPERIQIGGNETTGKGLVSLKPWE